MKTKFMLGAIVVAVLAVFGVIGLRHPRNSEASYNANSDMWAAMVVVSGSQSVTVGNLDNGPGLVDTSQKVFVGMGKLPINNYNSVSDSRLDKLLPNAGVSNLTQQIPNTAASQVVIGELADNLALVNTSNAALVPAPSSNDDGAQLDIRIRDAGSIIIPNAHVTVLIDKVNPYYPLGNNLSLPNYEIGVPNFVLTATITVIGPPASITVAAASMSLNCGEKATNVCTLDSAVLNVSGRTRVELVANSGDSRGTTAYLGSSSVAGGNVYPVSLSSAETYNGVATANDGSIANLRSTDHVGPYGVVLASSLPVVQQGLPSYAPAHVTVLRDVTKSTFGTGQGPADAFAIRPPELVSPFSSLQVNGPSSAPVNAQAAVTCKTGGAITMTACATISSSDGKEVPSGPSITFAPYVPNAGDAGLASSNGSSWTLVAGALMVIAISGAAVATVTRR